MSIPPPPIDERTYQDILSEAITRIPVHNPEWTNFNDSDGGITLLQLMSWMTESILYRANQIPARNRVKFLNLLGVPRQPAAAARGVITISNERGPLETVALDRGLAVQAGKIGFVTEDGLDVVPVEARFYLRKPLDEAAEAEAAETFSQLYGSFSDTGVDGLQFYRTTLVGAPSGPQEFSLVDDTVDGSIWLALLARKGDDPLEAVKQLAGRTLSLGLMEAIAPEADESIALTHRAQRMASKGAGLDFAVASGTLSSSDEPAYEQLGWVDDVRPDELRIVQVALPDRDKAMGHWEGRVGPLDAGTGDFPPSLVDEEGADRLITWIRIRLPVTGDGAARQARLSWVGVNAARVVHKTRVLGEILGVATGEPDQQMTLANTPVLPGEVQLTVGGEEWTWAEDLSSAPPEVPVRHPSRGPGIPTAPGADATPVESYLTRPEVFSVDRESGTVQFGDGLRGARPRRGLRIVASYSYGGGADGNVGAGAISASVDLPSGFKATNPVPTRGGTEEESVEDAERNIPMILRHRDRAVSGDDFRDLAWRTPAVEMGRVEVLPLFAPEIGREVPGAVTVMVIPRDPATPRAPMPDRVFLRAVCEHLEPRRVLTSELHVAGPRYVRISVSVGVDVVAGRSVAPVLDDMRRAVADYLSPLHGAGPRGEGWPLEKAVLSREIWAAAARVDGVASVRGVILRDDTGAEVDEIPLRGLELPHLTRVDAAPGEPLAAPPAGPPATGKRVPVPVIPTEC